jgi:hypothetical protein
MAFSADGPDGSGFLSRQLGLVGQVATSWAVAGGLVSSLVVTAHVAAGNLSSSVSFITTSMLFLVGSLVGFVHGSLLAYLGRPDHVTRRLAIRRLGLSLLYDVPAVLLGWVVAMVITLSAVSAMSGRIAAMAFSAVGWIAAALLLWWAVEETVDAARNLFRRWPDARSLALVLVLAFLVLVPAFLFTRPEIWGTSVRPTATAAAAMAVGATLWIAGPLGVLGLLVLRAWHRRHPAKDVRSQGSSASS